MSVAVSHVAGGRQPASWSRAQDLVSRLSSRLGPARVRATVVLIAFSGLDRRRAADGAAVLAGRSRLTVAVGDGRFLLVDIGPRPGGPGESGDREIARIMELRVARLLSRVSVNADPAGANSLAPTATLQFLHLWSDDLADPDGLRLRLEAMPPLKVAASDSDRWTTAAIGA